MSNPEGNILAVGKPFRVAKKDLNQVTRLAMEREHIQAAFNQAIVKAVESGETYRDVAAAGRISHQRIGQIIKAHREKQDADRARKPQEGF